MNIAVLLTRKYPYDSGEEFIESEIGILARSFDKVYIIATSVSDSISSRFVPANVQCFAVREQHSKFFRYIKYISASFISSDILLENERKNAKGLLAGLGCRYAYARAKRNAERSFDFLQGLISPNDHVVIYSYWFSDLALSASMLRKMFPVNKSLFVSRAHGWDLYAERNITGTIPFAKYILNDMDLLFPCSRNGAQYALQKWSPPEEKVQVSYLGTIDHGCPVHNRKPFVIVTCSGIEKVKRLELAAKALSKLSAEKEYCIHWVCIGNGPLLNDIKDFAGKELTDIHVEFLGRLSNSAVLNFYKENSVSLFLNTSSSEGLPVAIMEAASFGIPVLATNVGGTREIVRNGENGFLMSADPSPEEIADHIREILTMPDKSYQQMCTSARALWEKSFDAEKNYEEFVHKLKSRSTEKVNFYG